MCTRNGGEGAECGGNGSTNRRAATREDSFKRRAENRIRDRNGYRQRAAAFCARLASSDGDDDGLSAAVNIAWPPNLAELEVLMVSGRTAGDAYWVLPGGGVENRESTEEAVVRELHEEAGILGKVVFYIGEYIDDQRFHHTTLYFLTVVKIFTKWEENCENGRQRRWMRMEEARQSIKHNQLDMLEQSLKVIERTLGHNLPSTVTKKCLLTTPTTIHRIANSAEIAHQQFENDQKISPPNNGTGLQQHPQAKTDNKNRESGTSPEHLSN